MYAQSSGRKNTSEQFLPFWAAHLMLRLLALQSQELKKRLRGFHFSERNGTSEPIPSLCARGDSCYARCDPKRTVVPKNPDPPSGRNL